MMPMICKKLVSLCRAVYICIIYNCLSVWKFPYQVARPGTSFKKPGTSAQGSSTSQGIRPMSQSGRPVSGFVRPGTQSGRPGTMEQAIKTPRTAHTARPVTR